MSPVTLLSSYVDIDYCILNHHEEYQSTIIIQFSVLHSSSESKPLCKQEVSELNIWGLNLINATGWMQGIHR